MATAVIVTEGLVKQFGNLRALDGLDLAIDAGEVHGFLGPNGAGKSTTIRVVLGLLRKTSGTVRLFDRDPWIESVDLHTRLAYVPGDVSFWPNLSGGEIIDLMGDLRGGLSEVRRAELLEAFELDPTKKFHTYSKGNRQKVALISALASDVELYILDEPTNGLDPLMESVFQREIQMLKSRGKTVLLSSHILAEAEALCDRVSIIRRGQIVESGDLAEIRQKHSTVITVQTRESIPELAEIDGVSHVSHVSNGITFEVQAESTNAVLSVLANHNIEAILSEPPSLEHLFLSHYEQGTDLAK